MIRSVLWTGISYKLTMLFTQGDEQRCNNIWRKWRISIRIEVGGLLIVLLLLHHQDQELYRKGIETEIQIYSHMK